MLRWIKYRKRKKKGKMLQKMKQKNFTFLIHCFSPLFFSHSYSSFLLFMHFSEILLCELRNIIAKLCKCK